MKINVIVCGPAIGKTYLAAHDDRFVDLDQERAIYKYNLKGVSSLELEAGKLNRGEIAKHDSKEYILKRLTEELNNGKCVLLSVHKHYIKYLIDNKIPYCLVYAGLSLRDEYAERMRKRGNAENFVNECANPTTWVKFYEEHKADKNPTLKIELKVGEYLADVIDQII